MIFAAIRFRSFLGLPAVPSSHLRRLEWNSQARLGKRDFLHSRHKAGDGSNVVRYLVTLHSTLCGLPPAAGIFRYLELAPAVSFSGFGKSGLGTTDDDLWDINTGQPHPFFFHLP